MSNQDLKMENIVILILISIASSVLSVDPDQKFTEPIFKHIQLQPKVQEIKVCSDKCICIHNTGEELVICKGKFLSTVPSSIPTTVTSLDLDQNNFTRLDGDDIRSFNKIKVLTLSRNRIINVMSNSLDSLTELKILDLSYNRITSIPSGLLLKLKNLMELNLSNNKISTISTSFLYRATSLKTLDISKNLLLGLDEDQFVYLQNLEYLDLSFNKLTKMKHDWFQGLNSLQSLNLSHNQFISTYNLMFVNMINLKTLDLSFNNISILGSVSFKGLVKLLNLRLQNNRIKKLPYRVFSLTSDLKYLDLSDNPFATLKEAFYKNAEIRQLMLNNLDNLESLDEGSFNSLINVEELQVSGNRNLKTVDRYALHILKKCKYLNLTNNALITLPRHIFDGLKSLRSISLYGNPWRCDCEMFWLFAWLRSLPVPATHFNLHEKTFCFQPLKFQNVTILDALDATPCTNATIIKTTKSSQFKVGSSALLQCETSGFPSPNITWIAPDRSKYHTSSNYHNDIANNTSNSRVRVYKNGSLLISKLLRNDAGYYICIANNVMNNFTKHVHVMLDYRFMNHIKIISYLVGFAFSAGFLLISLVVLFFIMLAHKFGWHCCCSTGSVSPKTKQIRKMLEYMEQYKQHQLDKLKENYAQQTQKIKDNCGQQMEKLRESYSLQFEKIQNIRDYGNQQIDRVRDNYNQQVQRVRDYSAGQLDKLRDNYLYQRNRIRKFSAHHLYKLRENYKLQQQHLNKIIENLNIDSCRTVCARTDSIIFEPELTMETVFRDRITCFTDPLGQFEPVKDRDTLSQNSAYFTPNDSMSRAESPGPSCESDGTDEENTCHAVNEGNDSLEEITTNVLYEAAGGTKEICKDTIDDIEIVPKNVHICHSEAEV